MPSLTATLPVAVIGAGPAGMAVAAALGEAGHKWTLIDRQLGVGGLWSGQGEGSSRVRDLCLVTSRGRLGFSGFPMVEGDEFPHSTQVRTYLGRFAETMLSGRGSMRLGHVVTGCEREGSGCWRLRLAGGETFRCGAVVLCIGCFWIPYVPAHDRESRPKAWVHARDFSLDQVRPGDRIRVVGAGNSASSVALGAASRGGEVMLDFRSTPWLLPKYVNDRPLDSIDWAEEKDASPGLTTQRELARVAADAVARWRRATRSPGPRALPYASSTIVGHRLLEAMESGAGIWSSHSESGFSSELTVYATGYRYRPLPFGISGEHGHSRFDPTRTVSLRHLGLYACGAPLTESGGFDLFSSAGKVIARMVTEEQIDPEGHARRLEELGRWKPDLLLGMERGPIRRGPPLVYSRALRSAIEGLPRPFAAAAGKR